MNHPVPHAARAAAARLAPEYGPSLLLDVEAALNTREDTPPAQYLDPVSLGALIVAIATLAWTVYNDLRTTTPTLSPDVVERQVRVSLRHPATVTLTERDHIIHVVVEELATTRTPDMVRKFVQGDRVV